MVDLSNNDLYKTTSNDNYYILYSKTTNIIRFNWRGGLPDGIIS